MPNEVTNEQMQARDSWCQEMLIKFDSGTSKHFYKVFTGDETWICQFDPETKKDNFQFECLKIKKHQQNP